MTKPISKFRKLSVVNYLRTGEIENQYTKVYINGNIIQYFFYNITDITFDKPRSM